MAFFCPAQSRLGESESKVFQHYRAGVFHPVAQCLLSGDEAVSLRQLLSMSRLWQPCSRLKGKSDQRRNGMISGGQSTEKTVDAVHSVRLGSTGFVGCGITQIFHGIMNACSVYEALLGGAPFVVQLMGGFHNVSRCSSYYCLASRSLLRIQPAVRRMQ